MYIIRLLLFIMLKLNPINSYINAIAFKSEFGFDLALKYDYI